MSGKREMGWRRSPVYRRLAAAGAVFGEVNGMACAMDFAGEGGELPAPVMLGDLSPLPRWGLKGRDALSWLRDGGTEIGAENNRAYVQREGGFALRLGQGEALMLSGLDGRGAGPRYPDEAEGVRAYPVMRSAGNVWFTLCGPHSAEALATLCAVDLRPHKFSEGAVAQTRVAQLNGIVMRNDVGQCLGYHVLADFMAAAYLWDAIMDAMAAFNGTVVGLNEIRMLEEMSQ